MGRSIRGSKWISGCCRGYSGASWECQLVGGGANGRAIVAMVTVEPHGTVN